MSPGSASEVWPKTETMARATAQLLLSAAFLLFALGTHASPTPPPLPDHFGHLADECALDHGPATSPAWEALESQDVILAFLIIPDDYSYDATGAVILIPCRIKRCLYPAFWYGQLPLGLLDQRGSISDRFTADTGPAGSSCVLT